jgi:hypothetical protein
MNSNEGRLTTDVTFCYTRTMPFPVPSKIFWLCFVASLHFIAIRAGAAIDSDSDFKASTGPLFKDYCFKCHSEKRTKGALNLERIAGAPQFETLFKTWDKVIARLEAHEMPPEDQRQPSEAESAKLIATVRDGLESFIRREAGDPGRIAMRRLTSAEYAYSILDLTGLDLGLDRGFTGDAVGGEGFSNVGDVQFVQDSTLEHYLEAAKIVASHAVIGAGPLKFAPDPGQTGQEISAIKRIQQIYLDHGFRHESGEGGLGFGLDHYPKAFYAAWRFAHREELGFASATLTTLAHEEGLDAPFVEHVWQTLHEPGLSFPSSEIAAAWRALPSPAQGGSENARKKCQELYTLLDTWQRSLAENAGDAEVATVLTEAGFHPSLTNSFRISLAWPTGTVTGSFQLAITPMASAGRTNATVLWHSPALRFRKQSAGGNNAGGRQRGTPLREMVTGSTAERLAFGRGAHGEAIGTNDFVTTGAVVLPIEFTIPTNVTRAALTLDGELSVAKGDDCAVRCVVSHQLMDGATVAATGTFSLVLANPTDAHIESFKAGVAEFARKLPQISHREADPADRDPIPAPFDNSYNNVERNEFHATLKYFRDDRFLTEQILEEPARRELEQAWTDLLTAFEYHNTFARFVARKFQLSITNLDLATITSEQIAQMPEEAKRHMKRLHEEYLAAREALKAAEPSHVDQALEFARLAWRRPLSDDEAQRLRSFYNNLRHELNHPEAMRGLLARILVAPAFLYRVEPVARASELSRERMPLSDRELASRLSYFLWSSIPDAELSRAAAAGELGSADGLVHQARRMVRDPKARRFATEFFGQWFGFYRFDGYRGVDTTRFTEFTDDLRGAMYDEAISFFEYIVRQDRPVHEILFADYSFVNRNLAQHYGIKAPETLTNIVSKINGVNQFHRGGLLRMGAVLTGTSAPLRTSAVKRGDWILRRVLGRGVPPPPGDAGSIPPDDVLADGKTVRQRLEAHRRDASCVNCHARMDPLGFALEHFDSIGRWRETYRDGQQIDASGKLNDGTEISEFEGLNSYLSKNEGLFNRTLCAKLLGYALGRAEVASDRPLLDQMTTGLNTDNRFSTLVEQIVASQQFRYRRAPGSSAAESKRVATLEK